MILNTTFPNAATSVTRARRLVTGALKDVPEPTRDAVEILLSEIASNCVRHTSSDFTVRVVVSDDDIHVEVTDHGGGVPQVRSPSPSEPTGRGLRIVELLSDRWGVTFNDKPAGKTVWFKVGHGSVKPDGADK